MRILAISDIHGMYDKLMELLELIKYNPKNDNLVLLGDYIDRGKEPVKALQKVLDMPLDGAVVLKGNHEQMLLDAWLGINHGDYSMLYPHLHNGGGDTWLQLKELPNEESLSLIRKIEALPLIVETEDYIFTHAGVDSSIATNGQEPETLLWAREEFICQPAYKGKTVVFGHTPTKFMGKEFTIWNGGDKIGIDCGCVFGGKLACLELPSMKEYYV
jgi:serine/threonine protein phosphatase 1